MSYEVFCVEKGVVVENGDIKYDDEPHSISRQFSHTDDGGKLHCMAAKAILHTVSSASSLILEDIALIQQESWRYTYNQGMVYVRVENMDKYLWDVLCKHATLEGKRENAPALTPELIETAFGPIRDVLIAMKKKR